MKITYYPLTERPPRLNQLRGLGYKTFESKDFDLNLIGIRSQNRTAGKFDDLFMVIYKHADQYVQEEYVCTVDPSAEQHLAPNHEVGVAILKAGQYRGAYKLGKHRGKYKALVQTGGKVTIYRDNTLDREADHIQPIAGYFGINIHRAHSYKIATSTQYYSHGCTVIQHPADYARLISLCEIQEKLLGYKSFTYTLLED